MAYGAIGEDIEDWLLDQALLDVDLVTFVSGLCARVHGAGVQLSRVVLAWPTLHPLFDAETVTWMRGGGSELSQFAHRREEEESENWLASPMRHILLHRLAFLRRRLTGPEALVDFPLLVGLAEAGHTDYFASAVKFDIPRVAESDGSERGGVIVTWTTDAPGGFTDAQITLLRRLDRGIGAACRAALLSRIATNIAQTYLGRGAGREVLAGLIRRGDGRAIRAVIWYADLRGSTALAERLTSEAYLSLLNHYFECTAGAVVDHGGEVLDFIGDAVLAVFPLLGADEGAAARAATAACDDAGRRRVLHNALARTPPIEFGLALAVGEVMFGNIGIPARLAFSVIGPTVNAVARIEKATKRLGVPIIATAEVAAADPDGWSPLGAHQLDGVSEAVPLFGRRSPATVAPAP